MNRLLSFLMIFLLTACNLFELEFPYESDGTQININLVEKDQIKQFYDSGFDLDTLELEAETWLRHNEILFYDWSAQAFYLKNEKSKESNSSRYFVLKANEEPVFLGYFMSMFSSFVPTFPSIVAHDDFFYPKDVIVLGGYGIHETTTSLFEREKFRTVMEKSGLLKEGINVELTGLKRINSTTLRYTFKVTNLDLENIYIPDPKKMGESRFHYYTNGVILNKGEQHFSAQEFEVITSDNIKPQWYYKLTPGETIIRTVTLNGYENLPEGEVNATFYFPGSDNKTTGGWKMKDGWIWIGSFRAKQVLNIKN